MLLLPPYSQLLISIYTNEVQVSYGTMNELFLAQALLVVLDLAERNGSHQPRRIRGSKTYLGTNIAKVVISPHVVTGICMALLEPKGEK